MQHCGLLYFRAEKTSQYMKNEEYNIDMLYWGGLRGQKPTKLENFQDICRNR